MKRFLLAKPDGSYDKDKAAYNLEPLRVAVHSRIMDRPLDGWRIGLKPKEQGEAGITWRPGILSKAKGMTDLHDLCDRKGNLGDLYVLEHRDSGYQVRVRVAELPSLFTSLKGCSTRLKRHHRHMVRSKYGLVSWGRAACRNMAGTSTPSQHAGKPTNAEDWHGSKKEMDYAVKKELELCRGKNPYRIRNIIYDGYIYSASNRFLKRAYTGSCPHKYHPHIDYDPPATKFCVA